jgi:phosphate transport system permease protein
MTDTLVEEQPPPVDLRASSPRIGEKLIVAWLFTAAALSVLVTTGIVASLVGPTWDFFADPVVSFWEFLKGGTWKVPQDQFKAMNLVVGTLNVTMYALIIAIPGGLGAAIWLSEYASDRARNIIKPVLEVLEGVPTVAYGLFAFMFITPLLRYHWPSWLPGHFGDSPGIFAAGAAGLVMGVMLIPTIATISEDAMRAVPKGLREASYGVGATRMQTATRVVVPAAFSGIMASFVLGISRGIGETMLVLMAAGATANLTLYPNDAVLTMTAAIARTAGGDASHGTVDYNMLFAVGTLLFVLTLVMNLCSFYLVRRFRETYE